MKRVLSILLATLMLFGMMSVAAYADGEPTLTVSSVVCKPGDAEVVVEYSLSASTFTVFAIRPCMSIAGLTAKSAEVFLGGSPAVKNDGTFGGEEKEATCTYAYEDPYEWAGGKVYAVTYEVAADAAPGTYPVKYDAFQIKNWNDEAGDEIEVPTTVVEGTITVKDHDHVMTKVSAKAATCTEAGSKEYYTCSVCGKKFADKDGATEIADEDIAIAALGHTMTAVEAKEATCTEDGVKEACYYCSVCKKYFSDETGTTEVKAIVIKATGHKWGEWIIDTPATETAEGHAHRVCENDPTHTEEEVIPKLAVENDKGKLTFAETLRRTAEFLRQKALAEEAAKKAAEEAAAKAAEEAAKKAAEEAAKKAAEEAAKEAAPAIAEWKNPFTDVADDDYDIKAIEYVYENGLFKGVSDTEFNPDGNMTRAMFVTVLARLDGVDVSAYTTSSFTDCEAIGDWDFAPYVEWAAQNKIVLGYGDGKFGPNDPVTQEQAAVIIARYARYLGIDTTSTTEYNNISDFADWAAADLAWAADNDIVAVGVINFFGNVTRSINVGVNKVAVRSYVARMFYNFSNVLAD